MIGVICADREKPAVREFFQLFKTPWMFWESSGSCDVLVVTSAAALPESSTARLVIAFGASRDARRRLAGHLATVADATTPCSRPTISNCRSTRER